MAIGFAIAQIGLNTAETFLDEWSGNKQAKINIESIDEQMELLNKQKGDLQEGFQLKRGLLHDQYGNKVEDIREQFSLETRELSKDLYKMGIKTDVARSRSGMAFSGTVETGANIGKDDVYMASDKLKQQRKSGLQTLEDKLGMNMLDLTMNEKTSLNQIDIQLAGLEGEKKINEEESGWFGF